MSKSPEDEYVAPLAAAVVWVYAIVSPSDNMSAYTPSCFFNAYINIVT